MKFSDFNLSNEVQHALNDLGFETPTPIQEKSIPQLLESNQDLLAFAQTGTGKTAAFSLPVIQKVDISQKHTQAIILCPTRELCIQITNAIQSFTKYLPDLKVVSVYGGASIETQARQLNKGAQIVVGTPGRVTDMQKRKHLKLQKIDYLILDEADEMLSMGFQEELDVILEHANKDRQTLLFSATMPNGMERIIEKYMHKPLEIKVARKSIGNKNVAHVAYTVHAKDRYAALKRIVDFHPDIYGIVFCRTQRETKEVADKLMEDGYNADAIYGDLSQAQRDRVMNAFRRGQLQLLVATDVAARGVDVKELTHVINYQLPDEAEVYIHRSGRTGRAGEKGVSICLMHMRDGRKRAMLEKLVGAKFEDKLIPTAEPICERKLFHTIEKIKNLAVDIEQIKPFMERVYAELGDMTKEELIQHLVAEELNRFMKYYQNAPDLNANVTKANKPKRPKHEYAIMAINIGSDAGIGAAQLVRMIGKKPEFKQADIGDVSVQGKVSYFEIEPDFVPVLLETEFQHRGEPLLVSYIEDESKRPAAKPRKSGGGNRGGDRRRNGNRSGGFRGGRNSDRRSNDRRRSGGRNDRHSGGGRNRRDKRR
ncbi:DEAD/DEAH box helicase [bacterium DOLZORAL124_38_8]|nr:MAG: DEAD/DEAH box helicase [bacterium DOLZORAL124_38_8]